MKVTMQGKYRTRDGESVKILTTEAPGEYSVIGVIGDSGMTETWTSDGRFRSDMISESSFDLVAASPLPPSPLEAAARRVMETRLNIDIISGDEARAFSNALDELERIINE